MQLPDYGRLGREYQLSNRASTLKWLLFSNLDGLRQFLTTLGNLIDEEENKEVADIASRLGGNVDWADEYPAHWQDVIAEQLHQSFVVALMGSTEWYLHHLAIETSSVLRIEYDADSRAPGAITRARSCFMDRAGFAADTVSWNVIVNAYVLRNSIVHGQAVVDDRTRTALSRLAESDVRFRRDTGTVFDRDFCQHLENHVRRLFTQLFAEHERLCDRLRG